MTISSSNNKNRYEGNGSTDTFAFEGRIFAAGDLVVEIILRSDDSLVETLTLTTDYSVTITGDEAASVQVTNAAKIPSATQDIQIRRDLARTQTLDLPTGTRFPAVSVENALDRGVAQTQDIAEEVDRKAGYAVTSSTTASPVFPEPVADATIAFDGTTGTLKIGPTTAELDVVAGIADDIETVAAISTDVTSVADNETNVNTVAGSIANVNTTATNIASVNTVATNISDVTAVAGNATNINTVATNIASVNLVGGSITNVNTVATNIANVNAVATDIADVQTVAADLSGDDDIGTVATNIANVNTVAANDANITTVAGNNANITTVATDITNVNTTATSIANVNTVAGSIANVNTVATNVSSVNTVATNITDVQNAAALVNVNQQSDIAASSNTTYTIDYDDGAEVQITFTSNCTLAFTFPTGKVVGLILDLVDAGAYTITWPASARFAGGTVPTFTSSGRDRIVVTQDGDNEVDIHLIDLDMQ